MLDEDGGGGMAVLRAGWVCAAESIPAAGTPPKKGTSVFGSGVGGSIDRGACAFLWGGKGNERIDWLRGWCRLGFGLWEERDRHTICGTRRGSVVNVRADMGRGDVLFLRESVFRARTSSGTEEEASDDLLLPLACSPRGAVP